MSNRIPFPEITRREWMKLSAMGLAGSSASGWLQALADDTTNHPARKKSCILLWMNGGPSQLDTFDLKPGHENGGEYKPIDTSVSGIQVSEHLPKLAQQMEHIVPIRSMKTKEGDHSRGTFVMRTGYSPQGPIHFPTMGSFLSKELQNENASLPNFVSISPYRFLSPGAFSAGFLGPKHAPLIVGDNAQIRANPNGQGDTSYALKVKNLDLATGVEIEQSDSRLSLLKDLEEDFLGERPGTSAESHRTAYQAAVRMMRSKAVHTFDLEEETDSLRDSYGRNQFGQGCLLARRLVERGVPFVEVSLSRLPNLNIFGWDTHTRNFENVKRLSEVLDSGWSTLLTDLKVKGLLDDTLVVWMGEFGRTPKINRNGGRDHFPAAWTTVLSGGGIRGGQVVGQSSKDGMTVEDRPVSVSDFMATICHALGIDPMKQNMSNVGRPIRLADPKAKPIKEILS